MPKDFGDTVSDDEIDVGDVEDIPAEAQVNGTAENSGQPTPGSDDSEVADEEGSEGEEYVVQTIKSHKTVKGEILYYIKWLGYPEDQNTWEPLENLIPHSRDALSEYHTKIGHDPATKILKKSKSAQKLKKDDSQDDTPASKRRKTEAADDDDGTYVPKGKDWTAEVEKVDTIERDAAGQVQVYLRFKNGKQTKVSMAMIKQRCPVPMLDFYEEHLKFN